VRRVAFLLAFAACGIVPSRAGAENDVHALTYVHEPQHHYGRAIIEEVALFLAGSVQYATEKGNATDWDLDYDWPSFQKKLSGEAVRFDNNRFDTNMLTHPGAGALYYLAARGNRLSIGEAFLYGAATSALWEYVGEIREKVSINDLIVTPISGAATGETFNQLGLLFARGRKSTASEILSFMFAPSTRIHDAVDGATWSRARETDAIGLPADEGHLIAFDAGASATVQGSARDKVWVDSYLGLHSFIANVHGWAEPGRASHVFDDGNVSTLDFETSLGAVGLTDLDATAQVAPVGWFEKDLARDGAGYLHGSRFVVAATMGVDYAVHRWDRTHPEEMDQISGVWLPGLSTRHDAFLGRAQITAGLELRPEFACVRALGIDGYFRAHDPNRTSIGTVLSQESYYYAARVSAQPHVDLTVGPIATGLALKLDGFWGIKGFDRYQEQVHDEVTTRDQRLRTQAWVRWNPVGPLVIGVAAEKRFRSGIVGDVSTSRDEATVTTTLGVKL
jgi:Domain of unknown function (DUF3943)